MVRRERKMGFPYIYGGMYPGIYHQQHRAVNLIAQDLPTMIESLNFPT